MDTNGTGQSAEKSWTVMVYMSSDNALASDCVWALTEMQASDFDKEKIAVVAQFDPPAKGIGTLQYDFTIAPNASIGMGKTTLESSQQKLNSPLKGINTIVGSNQNHQVPERPIEKALDRP